MGILGIKCCANCIPPKRHVGCHDKCMEYQKERKQYEKEREEYKDSINPLVIKGSFLGDSGQKRQWKRKERGS